MKTKTGIAILLIAFTQIATAQVAYEWDDYGVGFEVAADFQDVSESASEWELISSDGLIYISVTPWSDASITIDDLEDATISIAYDMIFDGDAEVDGDCGEIHDFDGCYVIGAVDGEEYELYLVALLMDVESDTNVQIIMGFNSGDVDEVVGILGSFYAYDD